MATAFDTLGESRPLRAAVTITDQAEAHADAA